MSRAAVRAGLAVVWAVFFDVLWLTGDALRYVGPRTAWVVPFGGIALTLTAAVALAGLRRSGGPRASAADGLGAALALLPVLAVVVLPAASLGAQAARVKDAKGAAAAVATRAVAEKRAPLTIVDVAAAGADGAYARKRGVTAGRRVAVNGLVSRVPSQDRVVLTRFTSSCCAADAVAFSATVAVPEALRESRFEEDQWLEVEGRMAGSGTSWRIDATRVARIKTPDNPYQPG